MKKENGITLIALVVTIIVLLILASVSLNLVMGENGMLGKASSSRNTHIIKAVEEKMVMGANTASIEGLGTITYENLENGIKDVFHGEYVFQENKAENELGLGEITIDPKNNDTDLWKITAKTDGGKAQVIVGKHGETQKSTDEPEEDPSGDEEEDDDIDYTTYADIFEYQVIDEDAKTAKITGIKNEHWCNVGEYRDDENYYYISEDENPIEARQFITKLIIPNKWKVNGKTYVIKEVCLSRQTDYITTNLPRIEEIVFPDCITKIETTCFEDEVKRYGNLNLKKIKLPKNLKEIGTAFFANCNQLTEIEFPEGLEKIGKKAFFNCGSLTEIEFPDSLVEIGDYAFCECKELENTKFPDSLVKIGNYAFYECTKLTDIKFPNSLKIIGEEAFSCQYERNFEKLELSKGLENIGRGAFGPIWDYYDDNDISIEKLIIPGTLNSLSEDISKVLRKSNINELEAPVDIVYALSSTGFKKLTVKYDESNPVVTIGDRELLEEVIIEEGFEEIGEGAFRDAYELTEIEIPDTVKKIGSDAFANCSELSSIFLPNSITEMGDGVFSECEKLSDITLPDSITEIGDGVFSGCTNLSEITLPDTITRIGNYAFCGCHSLSDITLPDSITEIGEWAFEECENLSYIILPDSVTEIGECAFMSCDELTVGVPGTINLEDVDGNIFWGVKKIIYFTSDERFFGEDADDIIEEYREKFAAAEFEVR